MKILLATDGSEHADAAIDAVTRGRYPSPSEVRVVSVVEPGYYPPVPLGETDKQLYDQLDTSAREQARAAVEKAATAVRAGDDSRALTVTTAVLTGSPKRVILQDAEAFGADLIVVGSHGGGALERFLLGSVSQAVALHAKCSVEIVRHQTPHAA
jgi:nucleotide-binding universal stress UspA family protein